MASARAVLWNDAIPHAADADVRARRGDGAARASGSKARRVAAQLPFAEDLLAAYYCAFDRETPLQVKAALIGALAYFVLPFDVDAGRAADARLRRRCRGAGDRAAAGGEPPAAGASRGGAARAGARARATREPLTACRITFPITLRSAIAFERLGASAPADRPRAHAPRSCPRRPSAPARPCWPGGLSDRAR